MSAASNPPDTPSPSREGATQPARRASRGRIAVIGTDTGVGKTIVTAAIAASALAAGRPVRVLKPVQTGAGEDDDAAEVDRLCGAPVARTCVRLVPPLAPAVAARLTGVSLEPSLLVDWIAASALPDAGDNPLTLVETAGGCAVEIAAGFDMAALARRCDAPAVLVCRPGLGTLNHALLSVEHLRAAGARVLGLVISAFPALPNLSERTNPAELERLTGLPLLGAIPRLDAIATVPAGAFRDLVQAYLAPDLGGRFDRASFLSALA